MSIMAILILVATTFRYTHASGVPLFTFKPIEQYVEEKGYPIEKHVVSTEDGYELLYHRVPHGRQGPGFGHGHPVLLAHGLLQSSALFLAMDNGLAYMLADAGFDVWLMNARGNTYSKKNILFSEKSKEFWDFSFHEMGEKDLPSAIEHILTHTHRPTLSYVGFSMGTTIFWVLADTKPEYMSRIDTMVAIAPIARPRGMDILRKPTIYKSLTTTLNTFDKLNFYEVRPFHWYEGLLVRALCTNGRTTKTCAKTLSGLLGLLPDTIHQEDSYISTQYMPAGTSLKNIQHFMQIGEKAAFQQFDYGQMDNPNHYRSWAPPTYDLKKVTCPVYFIASDKDDFSVKEDVEWLAEQLPVKPQTLFHQHVKDFKHLDFFYYENVKDVFYKALVKFLLERTEGLDAFDVA